MTDHYWVGGTQTWGAGTFWATTSGGPATLGAPGTGDIAYFDGNSGAAVVTISAGTSCGALVCTTGAGGDFTGTLQGGQLKSFSSVALVSGMTANFSLAMASGGGSLTLNGKTLTSLDIGSAGFAGANTATLNGTLRVSGQISIVNNTLNCQGNDVFADSITDGATSGAGTHGFTMGGGGTLHLTGTGTIASCNTSQTWNFAGAVLDVSNVGSSSRTLSMVGASVTLGAVTISAGSGALAIAVTNALGSLDFTGFSGSLSDFAFTVAGAVTFSSGMTVTDGTSVITLNATSGTKVITTNGIQINRAITFNGVGGTWQLADNFTGRSTRALTLTNGTLDLNGKSVSCGAFSSSNANTRVLNGSASTLSLNGVGTVWDSSTATGLTIGSGLAIKLTDNSASAKTFAGGGATFGDVWNATAGAGTLTFSGSNTFGVLKSDAGRTMLFTAGTTTTLGSTPQLNGTAGNLTVLNSVTPGSFWSISKASGAVTCSYLSLKDSHALGGAAFTALTSTDSGGNTGWIFSVAIANSTEYYVIWDAGVVKDAANNPIAALSSTTTWSFTTVSASTPLLDLYPTATMAYSFRKLRTAYAGSAVRIRRSSDNAEANIGFDGSGNFDTAAASAHIGGGSGFIVTWFDQSGNARDATNATAAQQPTYSATGLNSKPTMVLDGTNDRLLTATLAFSVWPTTTTVMAAAQDQVGTVSTLAAWDINGATFTSFWQMLGSTAMMYWDYGNTTTGRVNGAPPGGWTATPHLWEFGREVGNGQFITIDGNEIVRGTGKTVLPTAGTSPVQIGSAFSANYFAGLQSELVMWAADLAANRSAARANIKAYWGTP